MKRVLRILGWLLLVFLLLAAVFHDRFLTGVGSFLVKANPPEKADIIVVLAGDYYGKRILKGADLVREGYAPRAVVSGPREIYGLYECDLAIPFAVKAGYPESYFQRFENEAHSTTEEASDIVPELRRMGVHKFLLVTSDYHTRRAGNAYRHAAPDLEFVTVAAPDQSFTANGWWHTRQGRKIAVTEWMKTIASWLGL